MSDDIVRTIRIDEGIEEGVKFPLDNKLHRTGTFNEVSGRYVSLGDEMYTPELRLKADNVKQGSSDEVFSEKSAKDAVELAEIKAKSTYKYLQSCGIANEVARTVLPVSTYTEFYWTVDLHNLMHFLKLRMDSHAQKEIREYADALYSLCHHVVPITMDLFDEYVLNAKTFGQGELAFIEDVIDYYLNKHSTEDVDELLSTYLSNSELREFKEKLPMIFG